MSEAIDFDYKSEAARELIAAKLFDNGSMRGVLTARTIGSRDAETYNAALHATSHTGGPDLGAETAEKIQKEIFEGYNEAVLFINSYVQTVRQVVAARVETIALESLFAVIVIGEAALAKTLFEEGSHLAAAILSALAVATVTFTALGHREVRRQYRSLQQKRAEQETTARELTGIQMPVSSFLVPPISTGGFESTDVA